MGEIKLEFFYRRGLIYQAHLIMGEIKLDFFIVGV